MLAWYFSRELREREAKVGTYLVQIALMILPWNLRRRALRRIFGYEIAATARIGFSIVAPTSMRLAPGSYVGHLNVIRGMERLDLSSGARISHLNWIYGIPKEKLTAADGPSSLVLAEHAGITRRHMVDCSAPVRLGKFSLVAGYGTQILTHSVDLAEGRQSARAIRIGDYAFIGTRSVILGGAELPAHSALGAGSTLRERFVEEYLVLSGVPARAVAKLDQGSRFFHREEGRVE